MSDFQDKIMIGSDDFDFLLSIKKLKMKKVFKISGLTLATTAAMILSQTTAFAANNAANSNEAVTGMNVVGGMAILLAFILVPLAKKQLKTRLS